MVEGAVLANAWLNRGTNFDAEERRELGIEGLLPPAHESLRQQADRVMCQVGEVRRPGGVRLAPPTHACMHTPTHHPRPTHPRPTHPRPGRQLSYTPQTDLQRYTLLARLMASNTRLFYTVLVRGWRG